MRCDSSGTTTPGCQPTWLELTPHYLTSVPLDPYTLQPLVYRRLDSGYRLYSTGRDGLDDGGQFIYSPAAGYVRYDLDLSWSSRKR